MKKFQDYFDEAWENMTFSEKTYYKWISFWGWIECYYQIFMHRVFKVDWHKNDKED